MLLILVLVFVAVELCSRLGNPARIFLSCLGIFPIRQQLNDSNYNSKQCIYLHVLLNLSLWFLNMTDTFTIPLDTIRAKTVVKSFIGWHDTADDGSFKTRGAIACNGLKERIIDSFSHTKPINYHDSSINSPSIRLFYQTLYKGQTSSSQMSTDRRMAFSSPQWCGSPGRRLSRNLRCANWTTTLWSCRCTT